MRPQLFNVDVKPSARGVTAAIALLAFPLVAAESQDEQRSSWGLGLGVMSNQKAYTDSDRDTKVIPFLSYENEYIEILGPNLKYKLPGITLNDSNAFNFGIIGKYDFTNYEADDAPILNGMEDRDGGFWAGAVAEWQNNIATVSLEFLTEVAGDSEGSMVNLGFERTWHFGDNYMLTPRAVFSWVDESYVDYYYGVRTDEVTSGRTFYQGEAGLNTEIGLRGGYMFNQKHMIFLDFAVTSLADEIKDSPLVDSSTESQVSLAYIYRF